MMIRRHSELIRGRTLRDRYNYLALRGTVAEVTFGSERFINQKFYRSSEWRHIRDFVIVRDGGCDLGVPGYEIHDRIYIHHMNPLRPSDIKEGTEYLLEPEYLITTTHQTHNAIHYGDEDLLPRELIPRRAGDTKLW